MTNEEFLDQVWPKTPPLGFKAKAVQAVKSIGIGLGVIAAGIFTACALALTTVKMLQTMAPWFNIH
jgi:hypothetical protein